MHKGSASDIRVKFERGLPAHMMAIDGTWRRECVVNDVSDSAATLTVSISIEGLNLNEIFLLLSSTGLVYRHGALEWVNGDRVGVAFLRPKARRAPIGMDSSVSAESPAASP
jgi:hypothetical protein